MNIPRTYSLLQQEIEPLVEGMPRGDPRRVVIELCLSDFQRLSESEARRKDREEEVQDTVAGMRVALDRLETRLSPVASARSHSDLGELDSLLETLESVCGERDLGRPQDVSGQPFTQKQAVIFNA